jgi:hypothetical protein
MRTFFLSLGLILFLFFPTGSALGQSLLPPRVIAGCHEPDAGRKLHEWSKQLAVTLPSKDVKFRRGKVDVDYIRDTLQRKSTSAFMSFWAGPLAFGPDPPKDLVEKSSSFSKRELHTEDGSTLGMESAGVTADGRHWRWTFIASEGLHGLEYTVVSSDDAEFFDRVIDSLCRMASTRDSH